MKKKRMTRKEIAEVLGVSRQNLEKYISGLTHPKRARALTMAKKAGEKTCFPNQYKEEYEKNLAEVLMYGSPAKIRKELSTAFGPVAPIRKRNKSSG